MNLASLKTPGWSYSKGLAITQPPNISANIQVTPVSYLALSQQMPDGIEVSYPHPLLPHVSVKYGVVMGLLNHHGLVLLHGNLEQIIH